LAGTEWELKVRRVDANPGFSPEAITLQFLPNKYALIRHGSALYMPQWAAKGNDIVLQGEGWKVALKFANGPTTGSGYANLNNFEVTALDYKGVVDLSTPFFQAILKNDTCAFANRALHTTFEGFWQLPQNGAFYQVKGSGSSNRYGDALASSVRVKSNSFKGVRGEYERRIADLAGCVVTIHERPYGLEMLNETDPADKETSDVDTLYRLRDAPDYLSDLRVHINGNWRSGSAWVGVSAGIRENFAESVVAAMNNAEARLLRKHSLTWTPVSTAPSAEDPLAGNSAAALQKAGDAIWALYGGETGKIANWGARAIRYYHAACEKGAMAACGRKATIMGKNLIGNTNTIHQRVRPLYEKGCTAGDADSCYRLATNLRDDVFDSNPRRAIAMFEKLCEEAHAEACGAFANEVAGLGSKILNSDWARAGPLFRKACALGDEFACLTGGQVFMVGMTGLPKDLQAARNMFTSACTENNWLIAKACRYAGVLYVSGQGGPASEDVAKLMFKRGCDFQDADSCKVLSLPVPAQHK
jgi:TPR repeat protein